MSTASKGKGKATSKATANELDRLKGEVNKLAQEYLSLGRKCLDIAIRGGDVLEELNQEYKQRCGRGGVTCVWDQWVKDNLKISASTVEKWRRVAKRKGDRAAAAKILCIDQVKMGLVEFLEGLTLIDGKKGTGNKGNQGKGRKQREAANGTTAPTTAPKSTNGTAPATAGDIPATLSQRPSLGITPALTPDLTLVPPVEEEEADPEPVPPVEVWTLSESESITVAPAGDRFQLDIGSVRHLNGLTRRQLEDLYDAIYFALEAKDGRPTEEAQDAPQEAQDGPPTNYAQLVLDTVCTKVAGNAGHAGNGFCGVGYHSRKVGDRAEIVRWVQKKLGTRKAVTLGFLDLYSKDCLKWEGAALCITPKGWETYSRWDAAIALREQRFATLEEWRKADHDAVTPQSLVRWDE